MYGVVYLENQFFHPSAPLPHYVQVNNEQHTRMHLYRDLVAISEWVRWRTPPMDDVHCLRVLFVKKEEEQRWFYSDQGLHYYIGSNPNVYHLWKWQVIMGPCC